jgi:hypothetical protein
VKKDEDHHQLAGENRHHRTTVAADGYASRITEEDKKRGEFSRVDITLSLGDVHTLLVSVSKFLRITSWGGNNLSFRGRR